MGRAVSDQTDLSQHKECPLFSNGQGCVRSDRPSTTQGVSDIQQWIGLSQIIQTFHNTRSVRYSAMGRAVSDQIDLPQNQGWLLCSSGQGCLRSDRFSTTPDVYVVTQLSTLSQIRLMFHNTRGVCCSAMGRNVSDQTDLPQHQWAVLSDGRADHPLNHTAGLNQTHGPSRLPPETHDP